jgi:hypothetical protein
LLSPYYTKVSLSVKDLSLLDRGESRASLYFVLNKLLTKQDRTFTFNYCGDASKYRKCFLSLSQKQAYDNDIAKSQV